MQPDSAACFPEQSPSEWIEVSPETMKMLREAAKIKNCTVSAALEEAVREFDPEWEVGFGAR